MIDGLVAKSSIGGAGRLITVEDQASIVESPAPEGAAFRPLQYIRPGRRQCRLPPTAMVPAQFNPKTNTTWPL